ncbi:MAG: DUF86 domain-containing protein [bacterium]
MKQRDRDRVEHIIKACHEIRQFCGDVDKNKMSEELILRRAVERDIVIIGEAANELSDSLKRKHSNLPWADIVGMRNIIVHDYEHVSIDELWDTIENDIPELIDYFEDMLGKEERN